MIQDRLLVIDDEAGFRNYVRRVGEAAGYETVVTGDAEAFREHARTWLPSVVIVDLQMPGADGIELLRDLVEAKSTARVLIASGVDSRVLETAGRLAAEHGLAIAGTLRKPLRAALLKDTLERLREVERPLLASTLAHAVKTGGLFLDYQPKLDCRSSRIVGTEALVRWQHPTRGVVSPDMFIPLAEESGIIHDLSDWVVDAATRQAAAWRRDGAALNVAINLSAKNLENIALPDMIAARCKEMELPTETVTLELTESAAMSNPTLTMDVLTRLRLKGFKLSIDDFGTGYSSLVQLRRLPFSELKIDKSFVMQMGASDESRLIVEAVVGLGQKLGLVVVAEGVESGDALASLVALGVDAVQGYFVSPPTRAERVLEMVRMAEPGQAEGRPIISSACSRPRPNSRAADGHDRTSSGRRRSRTDHRSESA